jgi:hypothetical protein
VTPVGVRELAKAFGIEGAPPTDACKGPVASLSRGRAAVIPVRQPLPEWS